MILATTTVENVDRFLEVFGSKGADKRALHGSKGSTVFRDPTEEAAPRVDVVDDHLGEVDVGNAHERERAGLIGDETDARRTVE